MFILNPKLKTILLFASVMQNSTRWRSTDTSAHNVMRWRTNKCVSCLVIYLFIWVSFKDAVSVSGCGM